MQPIPDVTEKDVERIVIRDYGQALLIDVLKTLGEYGSRPGTRPGSARVHLAILKVADGNLDKLAEIVEVAISDFRDVVSMAEYPNFTYRYGTDTMDRQQAIDDDWKQYREWLDRIA